MTIKEENCCEICGKLEQSIKNLKELLTVGSDENRTIDCEKYVTRIRRVTEGASYEY